MFGRRRKSRLPWSGTPQVAVDDARPHTQFLEKALSAAAEWTRFADPKLIGVLALLGLGLASIVSKAGQLWDAHEQGWVWGWLAAGGFVAACLFAALTVISASLGLFPRTKHKAKRVEPSLFYFAGVATIGTPEEYERRVRAKTQDELDSELAHQVWEVACVATKKHFWARWAYRMVILFLVAWVIARVALSFVS